MNVIKWFFFTNDGLICGNLLSFVMGLLFGYFVLCPILFDGDEDERVTTTQVEDQP